MKDSVLEWISHSKLCDHPQKHSHSYGSRGIVRKKLLYLIIPPCPSRLVRLWRGRANPLFQSRVKRKPCSRDCGLLKNIIKYQKLRLYRSLRDPLLRPEASASPEASERAKYITCDPLPMTQDTLYTQYLMKNRN